MRSNKTSSKSHFPKSGKKVKSPFLTFIKEVQQFWIKPTDFSLAFVIGAALQRVKIKPPMPAFKSPLLSSSIYLETNFRWVNQSQDEFRQMKHSPGNQRIKRKNHTFKALCLTLHLWFWTAQWNQITHHCKLWGNIGLTTMLQINSRSNSSKTVTSHRERTLISES